MQGRKNPYTAIGIKRCKCVRCGKRARYQWQICADGNTYRPLCAECDIELNELVLKWARFLDWESKMQEYKKAVRANHGNTK